MAWSISWYLCKHTVRLNFLHLLEDQWFFSIKNSEIIELHFRNKILTLGTWLIFPRPKGKGIINSWMDIEPGVSSLDCANPSICFNIERTILSCTTSYRNTTWVGINKRSTSRGYAYFQIPRLLSCWTTRDRPVYCFMEQCDVLPQPTMTCLHGFSKTT